MGDWYPEERLMVAEAIYGYTTRGHHLIFIPYVNSTDLQDKRINPKSPANPRYQG